MANITGASMGHLKQRLFAALASAPLCACISFSGGSIEGRREVKIESGLPQCAVQMAKQLTNIALAHPTTGLFVGVSQYAHNSGVISTPAHTISAAMFREPFVIAARSTGPEDCETVGDTDWCRSGGVTKSYGLHLLSDLRLRIVGEMAASVDYTLSRVEGAYPERRLWSRFWEEAERNEDDTLSFVDGGEPPTRGAIINSLKDLIVRSENTAQKHKDVLAVLYVSAHGILGSDSQPYILPADGKASEPGTWLAYDDVISPISDFVARTKHDGIPRRALVVLDTCQRPAPQQSSFARTPRKRHSPNAFVVESSSPGQYSWHWVANTKVEIRELDVKDQRWTFPPNPFKPRGNTDTASREFVSKMSALPLASNCAISSTFHSVGGATNFLTTDWFSLTSSFLSAALRSIPEVREADERQDMRVLSGDSFDLFVRTAKVK